MVLAFWWDILLVGCCALPCTGEEFRVRMDDREMIWHVT